MEKHGSETFFVLGEGLLGETVGGREPRLAADAVADTPAFRFSRMGPKGTNRQLSESNRKRIGNAIAAGGGGASQIPAGFTYLGQFIDHDLTFDVTNVTFGEHVSPSELLQARSPSLDLDSLYGAGPQDPDSAKFYAADGLHLKMGRRSRSAPTPRWTASTCPAAPGPRLRPSERRSSPTPETTRTSRSPRPTSRSSAFTTASSTPSPQRHR